jgi:hypothetical protein
VKEWRRARLWDVLGRGRARWRRSAAAVEKKEMGKMEVGGATVFALSRFSPRSNVGIAMLLTVGPNLGATTALQF